MADHWYLLREGATQPEGPFSPEELVALRGLTPAARVNRAGTSEWISVAALKRPDVAPAAPAPPVAALAPPHAHGYGHAPGYQPTPYAHYPPHAQQRRGLPQAAIVRIVLGSVAVVVVVAAAVVFWATSRSSPRVATATQPPAPAREEAASPAAANPAEPIRPRLKVDAATLLADYENEAAVEQKYGGRRLVITGIVNAVERDLLDKDQWILKVGTGKQFEMIFLACYLNDPSRAATLKKGDKVTVSGLAGRKLVYPRIMSCRVEG